MDTKRKKKPSVALFPHRTTRAAAEHLRAVRKFDAEGGIENALAARAAGLRYMEAFRSEFMK